MIRVTTCLILFLGFASAGLVGCYATAPLPEDSTDMKVYGNPWKARSSAPERPETQLSDSETTPTSKQRMLWAGGSAPLTAKVASAPVVLSPTGRVPRLAVMDIEDRSETLKPKILSDLTEYLRARITATGKFMVIDRSRQGKALKVIMKREKSESYKDCYSKQCQVPLGQALSADSIARASLTRIGGTYALSIEIVDLAKEATVAGAIAECAASPRKGVEERLLKVVREVATTLAGR